ncbi:unnamed protein product [Rhizoctonia solani]|uniref:DUF6533 domain-containing protein n=1 Tax=Rhizoctonia solani TaxID=456999 RepID=A0A8H3C043_9AGAM|nr:unnamed protein product [Rhizoctonia solani]
MSNPSELSPERLVEIAAEIKVIYESLDVTKHLSVAATTILIYDIISTIDDEINLVYVWIIANRISLFYVWGSIVVMWIVTATLIVRVWIIYGKGRWFLVGILASFLVITVPSIIIHEVSLMTAHWIPNPGVLYLLLAMNAHAKGLPSTGCDHSVPIHV